MADKAQNLQDVFLNGCRKARVPLTIFLVRGTKLGGVLVGFDAFSLQLRRDGQTQLIYKHAISTIAPAAPVAVALPEPAEPGAGALQERLLVDARRSAGPVTLYLMNGVMLQGRLEGHDQFALLVSRAEQQQLVYKHAISTLHLDAPADQPA